MSYNAEEDDLIRDRMNERSVTDDDSDMFIPEDPMDETLEDFKRKAFEVLRDGDGDMDCQDWINELVKCKETAWAFGNDDPPYVFSLLEDYWESMDYEDPDTGVCLTYRDWAKYFQNWTHYHIYEYLQQSNANLVEVLRELEYVREVAQTALNKINFYGFSRWGVTLIVAMDKPRPLTEDMVRKTLRIFIDKTLLDGINPYQQVQRVELRNDYGFKLYVPDQPEEKWSDSDVIDHLIDEIMKSQEMITAVEWFSGQTPLEPTTGNKKSFAYDDSDGNDRDYIESLKLYDYLLNLKQVEADYQ